MKRAHGRFVLAAVLVVLVAAASAAMAARARSWDPSCYATNRCDALTFRLVGHLLARGQSPYDTAARRAEAAAGYLNGAQPPFDLPFQYPPYALPLFAAASPLWRSDAGELLWAGLTAGLFVAAMAAFLGSKLPQGGALILVSLALGRIPIFNAFLGQTGCLVGALALGAAWLWTKRPFVAGLLIGLAMVKPQYAVVGLIVAIARKEWRIVAGALLACAALSAVSLALYGPAPWRAYPAALQAPNDTLPFMVSWPGVLARSTGVVVAPRVTMAVYVVVLAVLTGIVVRLGRAVDGASLFACAVAWTLAFSPNTHPYDLTLLAPALILLAARRERIAWPVAWSAASWIAMSESDRWLLLAVTLAAAIVLTGRIVRTWSAGATGTAQDGRLPSPV